VNQPPPCGLRDLNFVMEAIKWLESKGDIGCDDTSKDKERTLALPRKVMSHFVQI